VQIQSFIINKLENTELSMIGKVGNFGQDQESLDKFVALSVGIVGAEKRFEKPGGCR
jgi:hypothetical protein